MNHKASSTQIQAEKRRKSTSIAKREYGCVGTGGRKKHKTQKNKQQQQQEAKRKPTKEKEQTVRAAELSNGVDESVVEVGGPPEAGLGIRSQHNAWVSSSVVMVEKLLFLLADSRIKLHCHHLPLARLLDFFPPQNRVSEGAQLS